MLAVCLSGLSYGLLLCCDCLLCFVVFVVRVFPPCVGYSVFVVFVCCCFLLCVLCFPVCWRLLMCVFTRVCILRAIVFAVVLV